MKNAPAFDLPQLVVHALWIAWFSALIALWPAAGVGWRALLIAAGLPLHFWSYAVLHNHMHVPIAQPRFARALVSRTLGLSVGFPYRGYSLHHFNHHRFHLGPGDWGQLQPGQSAAGYCLRSVVRMWAWPIPMLRTVYAAAKPHQRAELIGDVLLVWGTVVGLCLWRPSLGVSWLLLLMAGQALTFFLNLSAHHQTDSADRGRLAVTSTSAAYNLLCFNAGHHQAHHLRPQAPWRDLPALTGELAAAGGLDPRLVTPLSPLHPAWVARVRQSYGAAACDPPRALTTSSLLR